MKLRDLKDRFLPDTAFFGNEDDEVSGLKAFQCFAQYDGMTYILASRIKGVDDLINHSASTFITDYLPSHDDGQALIQACKNIIYNKNARLQMAKLSTLFDYEKLSTVTRRSNLPYYKIHPTAFVDQYAEIGDGTEIGANVTIYRDVFIGSNCIIHSGTVIGTDGFGYEQDTDSTWFKIAHLGGVVIGNNVEIGANTCIDRGTLSDTVIEDGAKIDNLVHIAHNVHIKKNAMIIANAMIAGSVVIGEGAWIAPSSSIREGRKVGDRALVGLGSVVVKDVPEGKTVMGVPAKEKE